MLKTDQSFFISFEGIEGSGKSTQIELTSKFLTAQGFDVHTLREPGGTSFGEKLRRAILESDSVIHPLAEMHLFLSARAQNLYEKILPVLSSKTNKKSVVIMDRYIDSSIAYQGFARELGPDAIVNAHSEFPLNTMPDLTFYLDINIDTSLKRQRLRGEEKDYFEKSGREFYEKLILGYQYCAREFKRVVKVDATRPPTQVFSSIQISLNKLLKSNDENNK